MLPELDALGDDAVAAPERRQGDVAFGEPRFCLGDRASTRPAPRASPTGATPTRRSGCRAAGSPGTRTTPPRTAPRPGLRRAPDVRVPPVHDGRGVRILTELASLSGVAVREEGDASEVDAAQQDDPSGRSPGGVCRGECHDVRLRDRLSPLREPGLELSDGRHEVVRPRATGCCTDPPDEYCEVCGGDPCHRAAHGDSRPRSREILERERHAVAGPLIVHGPVVADRALGSTITDVDGNTFVDFVGGVGVANVGPTIRASSSDPGAGRSLPAYRLHGRSVESYVELAERLGRLVPIRGGSRAAFFNSGAEAVENAVKLARLATKRHGVIVFEGRFTGGPGWR